MKPLREAIEKLMVGRCMREGRLFTGGVECSVKNPCGMCKAESATILSLVLKRLPKKGFVHKGVVGEVVVYTAGYNEAIDEMRKAIGG